MIIPHFSKLEIMTAAKRSASPELFDKNSLPFTYQLTMRGENFNRTLGKFLGYTVAETSYSWQKYGMNIAGSFFLTFGRDPKYRLQRAHW